MVDFFRHENQPYPPSLSLGGKLRHGTKSDLLSILESNEKVEVNTVTSSDSRNVMIVDGAFLVQVMKPQGCKNIEEYAAETFVPRLSSYFKDVKRVDLVWDRYDLRSVKNQAREKEEKAIAGRLMHLHRFQLIGKTSFG